MLTKKTNTKNLDKFFNSIFNDFDIPLITQSNDLPHFINRIKEKLDQIDPEFKIIWELIESFKKLNLPIAKWVDLFFLYMAYHLIENNVIYFYDEEFEFNFLDDIEDMELNICEKEIEKLIKKYSIIVHYLYKKEDVIGIYKTIDEIKPSLDKITVKLKKNIIDGNYPFVKEVKFTKLENILAFYSISKTFFNYISPKFTEAVEGEKNRVSYVTDKKLTENIKTLSFKPIKNFIQKEKNDIAPEEMILFFEMKQDDYLALINKSFDLLRNANMDLIFSFLNEVFELNKPNKKKIAEILYEYLLEVHANNFDIELLTEEEWYDDQDRSGNLPTKRSWNNYKLRQVELCIPYFKDWSIHKN